MKTIKIFLASSEELDYDRMAFGNLVRRLDDMYEKRGIRIKLFEWEDYDSAYNDRRKQDEYNDYVRQSDIFLALFHKKAGQFTIEEFDLASKEFKEHASPKVYTYCKDLKPGEEETPELTEFKKRLFDEMGHYWCRYDNRESLHLQFVMQLQLVENNQINDLKIENGDVTFDGLRIVPMNKLKFAAANEDYVKIQQELNELHVEIEKIQISLEKKQQKQEKKKAKLENNPDDEDCKEEYQEAKEEVEELIDRLQPKLNKYNKLKEEFTEYQTLLFNTAKRIAQLQGERITDRMRRAMDAFNEGKVREANIILDEAEADARKNFGDYKQSKEITELKRQAVINSIEELLLKTTTLMSDASIPIEKRIERTGQIYAQADEMAAGAEYAKEKYTRLLLSYANFLRKYARYNQAKEIYERQIAMSEDLYGVEHPYTATSYDKIGGVYAIMDNYNRAIEFYLKALDIRKTKLGLEHSDIATSYHNIGLVYYAMGDYDKALDYHNKALLIQEKKVENLEDHADSYDSIGIIYGTLHNYTKAIDYFTKALMIREKLSNDNPSGLEWSYDHIGTIYHNQGDIYNALEYYNKALEIREKTEGQMHPNTAWSYDNIGSLYLNQCNSLSALNYFTKALHIRLKTLGEEHSDTAWSYDRLGQAYRELGDYPNALNHYLIALRIRESVLGTEHLYTARSYNEIGGIYSIMKEHNLALNYYNKALIIYRVQLDKMDQGKTYYNISSVYSDIGDNTKATEYGKLATQCYKEAAEEGIIEAQEDLGEMYEFGRGIEQDYKLAAEWYIKAAEQGSISAQYNLGDMYEKGKGVEQNISLALKWYFKAANQGHDQAQCTIGWLYDHGVGVEQNFTKAFEWFSKSAEQGNTTAQYNLGWMYEKGEGVKKDSVMAFNWTKMAAEKKDTDAQCALAQMYLFGHGVEQDYIKAIEWYQKATEEGYEGAYNDLAWTYHLMGEYEKALPWAEKAITAYPDNPGIIDTLATVYQGLGRFNEALEKFELCLNLYKEKEKSEEGIRRTEEKINKLKALMEQRK